MSSRQPSEKAQRILTVILQIPYGQVATYGQIARIAGLPKNSRQVGYILKTLDPGSDVPWFRVVNSKGEIRSSGCGTRQKDLLSREAIKLDSSGKVKLSLYQWKM